MKSFLWGNLAGKMCTVGTFVIVATIAWCIPNATNGLSLGENIFWGFILLGFWLAIGGLLIAIYRLKR